MISCSPNKIIITLIALEVELHTIDLDESYITDLNLN